MVGTVHFSNHLYDRGMSTIDDIQSRIDAIEISMSQPGFWSDQSSASKIMSEYSVLQKRRDRLNSGESEGVFPGYPVIMSIMSGAGGDDSEDFTRMLFEMYSSYCSSKGYVCTMVRSNQNDMGGYRSLTIRVEGDDAFEMLRFESGVHRLIRLSPFNAKSKRQTSFCMVEAIPDIVSDSDVDLKKDDLDIQFAKSGGAGGQNVNKRETSVRITHVPTGLTVHADSHRTQEANRDQAMTLLRGKLAVLRLNELSDKLDSHKVSKTVENEWGSQIRTYTLQPYRLVKDHRTGIECSNCDSVLNDGDIEQFTSPLRE
jgi:peptide chain release factor 2